jgi:hypothetical protein
MYVVSLQAFRPQEPLSFQLSLIHHSFIFSHLLHDRLDYLHAGTLVCRGGGCSRARIQYTIDRYLYEEAVLVNLVTLMFYCVVL